MREECLTMIFISYTRKDRIAAKQYEGLMISDGYRVWIDYRDLLLAHNFYDQIKQAIYKCDMVIFLNSVNSNNSNWVHLERKLVNKFDKPHIELDIENPNKTLNSDFSMLRRFAMQLRKTG